MKPDWLLDYGMNSSLKHISTEMSEEDVTEEKRKRIIVSSAARKLSDSFQQQSADAERHAIQHIMTSVGPPYPWDFFNDEIVIDSAERMRELSLMFQEDPEERAARLKEAQVQSKQFLNRINRKRRSR